MFSVTPLGGQHLGSTAAYAVQGSPRGPALGSTVLGTAKLGSLRPSPSFQPAHVPFQRSLGGAHPDLYGTSPILQFYDFTTTSGVVLRVVDFGDVEASAVPRSVAFDGSEYTSVKLGKPDMEEAHGGRVPQLAVSISDPTRQLLKAVVDAGGLDDGEARIRVIPYDDLSSPSLAHEKLFRVKNVVSLEGPARLAVTLGGPDLLDASFPAIQYNRGGCHNAFELRFDHAGKENYCSYPSDEFELGSAQNFAIGSSDNELELEHGWHVLNRTKLDIAESGASDILGGAAGVLDVQGASSSMQWWDSLRQGPYLYKIIRDSADSDAGIDVSTKVGLISIISSTRAGLLVQSRSVPGTWLFVGRQSTLVGEVCTVLTVNGVSVLKSYGAASLVHSFRVQRSGDTWSLYARTSGLDMRVEDTTAWTLLEQATVLIDGDINVGLAVISDIAVVSDFYWWLFGHMRFTAGGFTECNRTDEHCSARKNLGQRNAYLGLPDGVVGF